MCKAAPSSCPRASRAVHCRCGSHPAASTERSPTCCTRATSTRTQQCAASWPATRGCVPLPAPPQAAAQPQPPSTAATAELVLGLLHLEVGALVDELRAHHDRERGLPAFLRQLLPRLRCTLLGAVLLDDLGSKHPCGLDMRRARLVACQVVAPPVQLTTTAT